MKATAATLKTETQNALYSFLSTGLPGFAQKAHDRLRELGVSERVLGEAQEWTAEDAEYWIADLKTWE